jgi:hypothetical protein
LGQTVRNNDGGDEDGVRWKSKTQDR